MQQIYKRTPKTECDLFSCKFAAYFQDTFPKNKFGRLLLQFSGNYRYIGPDLISKVNWSST